MLTSSMTRTLTLRHRCSSALALSPGRIFGLIISWTRMPAALCSVRAFHWVVEMFLACAFEEATTNMEGDSAVSFGQMYSTALNTKFCTTWVLPVPPAPRRSM